MGNMYECYPSAPLNEYVQAFCCSGLEDPNISNILNDILTCLHECLLNKNLEALTLFKIVRFVLCGSFADGTRIKEDELEFDILAEVLTHNFLFWPSSTCPGYVHQVLASTSNPQKISDDFIHLISSHLPDCFSVVLKNDRLQLRYSGIGHTKIIIDIHPVVITRFSASSELHYVIPVSCKQPGHECWRISHFETEMNLLRNARRHHILSFRILKVLRRVLLPYGFELYAKYALKTAVCLHERSCTSNVDSDVKPCTLSILDIMFNGYRLGYLQSIVGGINIFGSIEFNRDTRKKALYISAVGEILGKHFDNTSTTLCMLRQQLCQHRSTLGMSQAIPAISRTVRIDLNFPFSMFVNNGFETFMPRYMNNTNMLVSNAFAHGASCLTPLNNVAVPQYCSNSVPTPQAPWFVG